MGLETALIVGAAMSAAASYQGAQAQAKAGSTAAAFEQQQANDNREMAKLQAADEEVRRRRDLARTTASNRAMAAGGGLDARSPFGSLLAFQSDNEAVAGEDIANIRLMGAAGQRQYQLQGDMAAVQGQYYRSMGSTAAIQAGGTLLGGAARAYGAS